MKMAISVYSSLLVVGHGIAEYATCIAFELRFHLAQPPASHDGETVLRGRGRIGKQVDFPDADPPSSWELVEKVSDKNDQVSAWKHLANPRPPAA